MPFITSRTPFTTERPYRPHRPATNKIIFLSCEGSATEEEYFERISEIYSEIKTKIQFISVAEDAVHTNPKNRMPSQAKMLSKVRPKQLAERINQFKEEKNNKYQFSLYPDDEFWVVADVDQNWSPLWIEEWKQMVALCSKNGYHYAVSNPFFEIWLLLHHDCPCDADKAFAVTDNHDYEKTGYFRERLRQLGVPLKKEKHIKFEDYNAQNVEFAIKQAEMLHIDKEDLSPRYFATTVYLLLKKMVEMLDREHKLTESFQAPPTS